MTFDPAQHPRGQAHNAGQFREKLNSDPETTLTRWTPDEVTVDGFALNLAELDDLPAWPDELPEPTISWGYDDDGHAAITVFTGGDSFRAYRSLDGSTNSITDHSTSHWSEDTRQAALAWGERALERAADLVEAVEYQATSRSRINSTIDEIAAGRPLTQPSSASEFDEAVAQMAAAREKAVRASAKLLSEGLLSALPDACFVRLDESDLADGYYPDAVLDEEGCVLGEFDGSELMTTDGETIELPSGHYFDELTGWLPRGSKFTFLTVDDRGRHPRLDLHTAAAIDLNI